MPHIGRQQRQLRGLAEDAAGGEDRLDRVDYNPGRRQQEIACVILGGIQ